MLDNRFVDVRSSHNSTSSKKGALEKGTIEMEIAIENTKDELFKLQEKVKKDFEQHVVDTDQVIMKLMEKMGENNQSKLEDASKPEVKQ